MSKKVFIKTFGCQMNEYDSDKMVDVMHAAEGYEATSNVDEADLILFNTCSVREKAQEKVFSDLGRVKHLKKKGVQIGVGGCVASQEGEAIIARAPFVDVVFGPQTLHRLPDLLRERRAQDRPQVDKSFDCISMGIGHDRPLGIVGSYRQWEGSAQIWAVLGEELDRHPIALLKSCIILLNYAVQKQKLRRVSLTVRSDYTKGNRFAHALGFDFEGKMHAYLPDGGDANLYARLF